MGNEVQLLGSGGPFLQKRKIFDKESEERRRLLSNYVVKKVPAVSNGSSYGNPVYPKRRKDSYTPSISSSLPINMFVSIIFHLFFNPLDPLFSLFCDIKSALNH